MFARSNKLRKIYKILNLDKPLVIFDVETTGKGISSDKIVEIAYMKISKDFVVKKDDIFLNPEIQIPDEATAVHGINNKAVKGKPTFKDKSQELWDIFNNCYYGGFNVLSFDLPVLRREFVRVGMDFEYSSSNIIDSKKIYKYMTPRTISSAYEHYFRKEYREERNAASNTEAVAGILLKQLEKYKEVCDKDFINKIHEVEGDSIASDNVRKFYWRDGETIFAFSKYKDQPLLEVAAKDPKFLKWILSADFSDETKSIIKKAMKEAKNK